MMSGHCLTCGHDACLCDEIAKAEPVELIPKRLLTVEAVAKVVDEKLADAVRTSDFGEEMTAAIARAVLESLGVEE